MVWRKCNEEVSSDAKVSVVVVVVVVVKLRMTATNRGGMDIDVLQMIQSTGWKHVCNTAEGADEEDGEENTEMGRRKKMGFLRLR